MQSGIWFANSPINNNYITNNSIFGQAYGINFSGGTRNYIQHNVISKNNNSGIFLLSASNFIINNQISCSNGQNGINVNGGKNNAISKNSISGQQTGIGLNYATNTYITNNNNIYDNLNFGISMNASGFNLIKGNQIYSNNYEIYMGGGNDNSYNTIITNTIGPNPAPNTYGIYLHVGKQNNIINNKVFKNTKNGISFDTGTTNNYIIRNQIYSNGNLVPECVLISGRNNVIKSNIIYSPNQAIGLSLNNAYGTTNFGNLIYNTLEYGIYLINSTNSTIANNKIMSIPIGINSTNSISSIVKLNDITNNNQGFRLLSGNLQLFTKNNMYNLTNFNNLPGVPYVKITNNWWNSTIASTNARRIKNNGGYSNFTIYRLFGPFDITGNSITPLPRITWATAL